MMYSNVAMIHPALPILRAMCLLPGWASSGAGTDPGRGNAAPDAPVATP